MIVVRIVKPVSRQYLEVGGSIDGTWLMVLIQCRSERSRVGGRTTELVLVVVGIICIVVMESLLPAPDSPCSVG